jgi:hypothetical protein
MKLSLGFKMLIIELEKYPNFLYLKHFKKCQLKSGTPATRMMMIMMIIIIWLYQ